jgi:glycosyltransferase involved in cell wall biosynthesis
MLNGMRILIVTHGALTSTLGASQIAINLVQSLRAQGHDVTLWSPQSLSEGTRWWKELQTKRAKLDEFLKTQAPFDVIDCPASFITRRASREAKIVARSVQPSILYIWSDFRRKREKSLRALIRVPFDGAYMLFHLWLILLGWRRADLIMCLGSLELQWMQRWFPFWRSKLASYSIAPSKEEQEKLASVRRARTRPVGERLRLLWIGRWVSHKGTGILIKFINEWAANRPQDSFTIAGCGPDAEKDCPAGLLKSGRLKIVPSFNREELYSLLAEHDVGLFTSKVEGWGLSLNEMLESGMPVYATPAGATSDLRPYFETLMEFPPTAGLINSNPTRESVKGYYDTFVWPQIAERYATDVQNVEHKLSGLCVSSDVPINDVEESSL